MLPAKVRDRRANLGLLEYRDDLATQRCIDRTRI